MYNIEDKSSSSLLRNWTCGTGSRGEMRGVKIDDGKAERCADRSSGSSRGRMIYRPEQTRENESVM